MQLNDDIEHGLKQRNEEAGLKPAETARRALTIYLDVSEDRWDRLRAYAREKKVTPGSVLQDFLDTKRFQGN